LFRSEEGASAAAAHQGIDFAAPGFAHFDQRRPGAFETFARQFLRRANAGFAADGDFAGGAAVRTFNPEKTGAGRV